MSKKQLLILGFTSLFLAFACLWIGSYVLYALPEDSWAEFPALITMIYLGIGGLVGGIFGCVSGFSK